MTQDTRSDSDAGWMIPFFMCIGGGIGFFFWQVAEYGLLH